MADTFLIHHKKKRTAYCSLWFLFFQSVQAMEGARPGLWWRTVCIYSIHVFKWLVFKWRKERRESDCL